MMTMQKISDFFIKHWLKIAGIATGTLGGYLYYHYVGCLQGTCPITSNPYRMMLYGAVVGYLLFELFTGDSSRKKYKEVSKKNDINQKL